VVTVSLESSGAEASRPYIEAAHAEHPSLIDTEHRMDALFGVVNIPNVVWIDEGGTIVRPAEPGWPSGRADMPDDLGTSLPRLGRAPTAPEPPEGTTASRLSILQTGQDRHAYADAIRDWAEHGPRSRFTLSPEEVVARSQPRSPAESEGAAHFELATRLWHEGRREAAVAHFNECHRLQPRNWTYRRQAYSLLGHERVGGEVGRFVQGPIEGEEDQWPFTSDFISEVRLLGEGEYYPRTM
jgi:hypothetical protein